MNIKNLLLTGFVLFVLGSLPVYAGVPNVVVSIKPIYSLVSAVMAGTGASPKLIVNGGASPHNFALRPSDAMKLSRADIVFWVGPGLESFLAGPIATLSGKARVIELVKSPFMKILPYGVSDAGRADPHIWLDTGNARAIVAIAVAELSALDAANSGLYRDNGERLSALLDNLDLELRLKLTPIAARPFIVYHDAYSYLVDAYGLNMAGYITKGSRRRPGASRLIELRRLMVKRKIRCLFHGPLADASLIAMLGEGMDLKATVVDPLGANFKDGPKMYFHLMRAIADKLVQCLGR